VFGCTLAGLTQRFVSNGSGITSHNCKESQRAFIFATLGFKLKKPNGSHIYPTVLCRDQSSSGGRTDPSSLLLYYVTMLKIVVSTVPSQPEGGCLV